MNNFNEDIESAVNAYMEGTISEFELNEILYEGKVFDTIKTIGRRAQVSLTNNYQNIKNEWDNLLKNAKSDKNVDKMKVGGQVIGVGLGALLMAAKGIAVGPIDWVFTVVSSAIIIPLAELNFPFNPTPTLKKLIVDPTLMEITEFHENTAKQLQLEVKDIKEKYNKTIKDVESGKLTGTAAENAIKKAQADLETVSKKVDKFGEKLKAEANKKIAEKYRNMNPEEKAKAEGKESNNKKSFINKYNEMRSKDKEKAIKLVDSTKQQIREGIDKSKK